ncbi:restriction endonuclease subunit S [Flavobacteriaceae bacterium D16]|nr:restriction endonuclease subunit S [Flavobacteriaceae bacterium D16]
MKRVLRKRIVPNGWQLKKIKDIGQTGSGGTPLSTKKEYYENGDVPWVNSGEVIGFKLNETQNYITKKGLEKSSAKLFPKGSVLVAMYGATAGKASVLNFKASINQAICAIIPNKSYNNFFLKYYIDLLYQYLVGVSTGSARDNLNQNGIQNLEIPFPSKSIQDNIAKVLSDIDSRIEINNKINCELESLAKVIYDYWFVQFDFPDANGKPYKSSGGNMVYNEVLKREIPKGWEVEFINDVVEVKDGTHDSPKYIENGYKLITSKHLKQSGLDFENAKSISKEDYININKRSKVDSGDILFSMIGNIGTIYKVEEQILDFAIKNVALYKTSENQTLKNYIYMCLKGYDMEAYMANVIFGSIQKFIGLGSLRKMPLLLNEQVVTAYKDKTEPIFRQMNNLKKENQKLVALRDWLLPMLMNGQVSVDDAKIEV